MWKRPVRKKKGLLCLGLPGHPTTGIGAGGQLWEQPAKKGGREKRGVGTNSWRYLLGGIGAGTPGLSQGGAPTARLGWGPFLLPFRTLRKSNNFRKWGRENNFGLRKKKGIGAV